MIDINQIVDLQTDTVELWHQQPVENSYSEFLEVVCQQHTFNYLLWHQEDIARSPDVSDAEIANVKRSIDKYNQQRNDWIEKIDDEITRMLEQDRIKTPEDAPLNTETPGSAIDRLSIMSLRLYHLREQVERTDVDEKHREMVQRKIAVCLMQQHDLSQSLKQLITAIFNGEKRHRTYRQFKMYNDPTLNPYLYKAKQVGA